MMPFTFCAKVQKRGESGSSHYGFEGLFFLKKFQIDRVM